MIIENKIINLSQKDLPPHGEKKGWPWVESEMSVDRDDGIVWPRITLITASYNKEGYIEEAIRSVLLQNYPNLEYIIIDGGSTDNSIEIIKKYRKWLAYWVSEPDRGQANAINKGIKKASGEIVSWVHADDMLFPGACHEMAKAFMAHHNTALIYGEGAKIDKNNKVEKKVLSQKYNPDLLKTKCYLFQPSTFIKRSALEKTGLLDESLHYWMDWDLYLRICRYNPAYRIDRKIGMWRAHEETKTRAGAYSEQRREIAYIGRKNNGLFDRNNVTFWALHIFYVAEDATSLRIFSWMRAKIAAMLDRFYGENTYYSAAMFEGNMRRLKPCNQQNRNDTGC